MTAALPNTDIAQASTYLEGAVDVVLRNRFILAYYDEQGRIKRDAQGKDYRWLLNYKEGTAQPYTPYQPLDFANENFSTPAAIDPVWWYQTSGMDFTEESMNSGPSMILDNYKERVKHLARGMQIYLSKAFYCDTASAAGAGRPIGLGTLCKKSLTIATANTDRIAPPIAGVTYAGLDLSLGNLGGSWSANSTVKMNVALNTDWPDGQGDPSNAYDGTSPRLYNENTNRWVDLTSAAANSDWRTNCVNMLSRANVDLRQNSIESMLPTVHVSGAERHQNVKDKLRESVRDTMVNPVFGETLGYHETLNFEGSGIELDHEIPSDRTYSLCAASGELYFYGAPRAGGHQVAGMSGDGQKILGGVFTTYGPERPAGSLQTVWIMTAGGNFRWQPKWIVCHSKWT